MRAYTDQRFGVFFCYGMPTYTDEEWATPNLDPNTFAPTGLNIDQWVAAAVSSGAKYATLTTKHHEGFALWPTAYHVPEYAPYSIESTDWYTNNGSPDIVSLFTTKCRAAGINPVLYFSIWDRTFEARRGSDVHDEEYAQMVELQLAELVTNYGDITAIWIDGWYSTIISYARMEAAVKSIQPNCLMVVNNHTFPKDNSDILEYEYPIDGDAPAINTTEYIELCDSSMGTWFWNTRQPTDGSGIKSAATINATIQRYVPQRITYNLAFTPTNVGVLPDFQVAVLGDVKAFT